MNHIAIVATLCIGTIYAAHAYHFHPLAMTIAALGLLAFSVASQPRSRGSRRSRLAD